MSDSQKDLRESIFKTANAMFDEYIRHSHEFPQMQGLSSEFMQGYVAGLKEAQYLLSLAVWRKHPSDKTLVIRDYVFYLDGKILNDCVEFTVSFVPGGFVYATLRFLEPESFMIIEKQVIVERIALEGNCKKAFYVRDRKQ